MSYTYRTLGGSKQLTVDYADIGFETRRITERYATYLYVGLVLFGVGGLLGGCIYETEQRLSGFNYAIFGLALLIAYFMQRKEYVFLGTGSDPVIVLGDGKTSTILSEINCARRARFLELLRRADFIDDEVKRRSLVAFLLEKKIFTNQEVEDLLKGREVTASIDVSNSNIIH